eukprot:TRINITY_DN1005_c0_g1_i2.p2 TRINITY_DN1005_c0_g1~~TRINITY_DN1005_c0_g1_i2.p2  ORF type:complete len:164 (-),score=54.22 TRINITY_DN1005_c0_g1_i2:308-799(-)
MLRKFLDGVKALLVPCAEKMREHLLWLSTADEAHADRKDVIEVLTTCGVQLSAFVDAFACLLNLHSAETLDPLRYADELFTDASELMDAAFPLAQALLDLRRGSPVKREDVGPSVSLNAHDPAEQLAERVASLTVEDDTTDVPRQSLLYKLLSRFARLLGMSI